MSHHLHVDSWSSAGSRGPEVRHLPPALAGPAGPLWGGAPYLVITLLPCPKHLLRFLPSANLELLSPREGERGPLVPWSVPART